MALRSLAQSALLRFDLAIAPPAIKKRFITLDPEKEGRLKSCLIEHYYIAKGKPDPTTTPELGVDFDDAVYGTVIRNRATVIPWLSSIRDLAGMRVLEVGTGAGGSIVPLAEQGAYVAGTDIDAESLAVAEERCKLYGVTHSIELHIVNATDLCATFDGRQFDVVVFFASLEHMTLDERCEALPQALHLLVDGGWLVIVETPNRLWWYDGHTSNLPFYNWLSDELAFRYRGHSERWELSSLISVGDDRLLSLTRLGRGASYHEFQVALPNVPLGQVASCMRIWQRRRNPLRWLHWELSGGATFARLLRRAAPEIPPAFFQPYLDFVLVKRSADQGRSGIS